MTKYKNDYKLTESDSKRISCDECKAPATTGQNNGGAPFWYRCNKCAEEARQPREVVK